ARWRTSPTVELRAFGDVTRWSNLEAQCLTKNDQPYAEPCGVVPATGAPVVGSGTVTYVYRGWRDTFGARLGGSYWTSPDLELFAGLGFESSAVPDNSLDP